VIVLPKGDVTDGVVRIGTTVRRPHQPTSLAVAHYLDHLQRVGFGAAPRYLGRDDVGRDVLTYLEGDVAGSPPQAWAADDGLLAEVGRLLRRLHEVSAGYGADTGFAPPPGSTWLRSSITVDVADDWQPELISHNDVTPQNVVFRDRRAVGLIDFDLCGPTTRLREVANTAMHWVPLQAPDDAPPAWAGIDVPARLRGFADAYGLDDAARARLVDLSIAGARVSFRRMRAAAEQLGGGWARMWAEGVGDQILRREAWLIASRRTLTAALLAGR
jgi:Ser/Thr protein kinase RdoA (MazF antagonist)